MSAPFINTLESRYKGSFTLLDAINDSVISENVEKFYVPEAQIMNSIFIKKDESIAVTSEGPKRIRFIYLNPRGKNITDPDSSYIQIAPCCKGFLARLSISRNNYTASNLEMDYFIDISNIKYRIDSTFMTKENNIVSREIIKFENIDINDYSKIDLDLKLKEFMLHKEELFQMYF